MPQHFRKLSTTLLAVTVLAAVGFLPVGPASASNSDTSSRMVREPITGSTVTIENEGDCNALRVVVTDTTRTASQVDYDVDTNCMVTGIKGTLPSPSTSAVSTIASTTSAAAASASPSQAVTVRGVTAAAATSCNYIHSSQTVQDPVNIDIAKLRLHSNRCWDGSSTWMVSDVWAEASTSVSWNHVVGTPWFPRVDWGAGTTATAVGSANFHSDWLWCNFTADWQVLSLTNTNVSNKDGTYTVSFSQSRACPGTHMATASKANSNYGW